MIRLMQDNEVSTCVNLIKNSYKTVADEFGITIENAPRFTAFATTIERLNYQIANENRLMYVYCDGGKIVGYMSILLQPNHECELSNLCVAPEYRHKRIGYELLISAFDTAINMCCTKIKIAIVEENKQLKAWYEKFKFIHTGTEKFDFFPFACGYMEKAL